MSALTYMEGWLPRRHPSPQGGRKLISLLAAAVVASVCGALVLLSSAGNANAATSEPTPSSTATLNCTTGVVSGTVTANGITSVSAGNANGFYEGLLLLTDANGTLAQANSDANGNVTFSFSFTPPANAISDSAVIQSPTQSGGVNIPFSITWQACATPTPTVTPTDTTTPTDTGTPTVTATPTVTHTKTTTVPPTKSTSKSTTVVVRPTYTIQPPSAGAQTGRTGVPTWELVTFVLGLFSLIGFCTRKRWTPAIAGMFGRQR